MCVFVHHCVWVCDRKQHFVGVLGLKSRFVPLIEFFPTVVELETEISNWQIPGGFLKI